MIIDLPRFLEAERPLWTELEEILDTLGKDGSYRMDLQQTQRFNYLYQRVLSDLGRIVTFSSETETRRYLESLTARAYSEMNESRDKAVRFTPFKWFAVNFPRVFRKHIAYFWLSLGVFLLGCMFGAGMLPVDPGVKTTLIPAIFGHLYQTPTQRVRQEEEEARDVSIARHTSFSAELMANNIKAAIFTFVIGITFGLGSAIFLFSQGVILGLIIFDYIQDGQTVFMLGWLLPHGVFEIPALLIAGQAGLLLGRTLLGRGDRHPLGERLRMARSDLSILVLGAAIMLVWAGIVESFLSQYHKPVVPYAAKITFGVLEMAVLVSFRYGWQEADSGYEHMSAELKIRTPEGIDFALPLAGPVTRGLACFMDLMLMSVLLKALVTLFVLMSVIAENFAVIILVVGWFVIQIGYGILFEWLWRGQTVGKRLFKLWVVDERGLRLEFTQVAIRNLMRFIDMLPGLYGVGGIACFFSKRCQRLGDLGERVVVRQLPVNEPDLDQLVLAKFNSLREHGHLAARLRQRVSPREAGIALEALLRRESFDPEARVALFGQIAARFKSLVVFPAEAVETLTDEQYLRNVVDILFRTRN